MAKPDHLPAPSFTIPNRYSRNRPVQSNLNPILSTLSLLRILLQTFFFSWINPTSSRIKASIQCCLLWEAVPTPSVRIRCPFFAVHRTLYTFCLSPYCTYYKSFHLSYEVFPGSLLSNICWVNEWMNRHLLSTRTSGRLGKREWNKTQSLLLEGL